MAPRQRTRTFLLERRVELNAIPSDVLVKWIEAKLKKHGVKKVVPDDNLLDNSYGGARWRQTW